MLLHPTPNRPPSAIADEELILSAAAAVAHDRVRPPAPMPRALVGAPRATVGPDQDMVGQLRRQWGPAHHPDGVYVQWVKPGIDRVIGAMLLLLTLPLLLGGMLVVRLTMGPNVIFRQQRVGKDGHLFTVYKLRTMTHDRRDTTDEDLEAMADGRWDGIERRETHKTDTDPRHTQLGRMLRKLSVDELPQLVNVLRGDMSLVGPRPELPVVLERHYKPWMYRRLVVRPGITGLWQVSMRGDGAMHEHVDIDVNYVDRISLREDIRILLATPLAALGAHKGV